MFDPRDASSDAPSGVAAHRPRVVALCGSMRFWAEILQVAAEQTAQGRIVLAPYVIDSAAQAGLVAIDLAAVHRCKIVFADEVIVVTDESDYIGESTRAEIRYARAHGKYLGSHQIRQVTLHPEPDARWGATQVFRLLGVASAMRSSR